MYHVRLQSFPGVAQLPSSGFQWVLILSKALGGPEGFKALPSGFLSCLVSWRMTGFGELAKIADEPFL